MVAPTQLGVIAPGAAGRIDRTFGLGGYVSNGSSNPASMGSGAIAAEDALRVARMDATNVYRDLASYRAVISFELDGWHVDYELKDPQQNGGGPHYWIDAATGSILHKRYDQ